MIAASSAVGFLPKIALSPDTIHSLLDVCRGVAAPPCQ